jgi:hypothetical protein
MKNNIMQLIKIGQAAAALLTCLAAGTSTFGNIISSYTINGNGTVTYSYKVDNVGGTFDISSWSLEFDFAQPDWHPADTFSGGQVTVPDRNWFADLGVPIQGQSAQDFLSLAPVGDVLVGQALGEFSFTSAFLPGAIAYYEFSANGDFSSGTTLGPISRVPEGRGPYEALALLAMAAFTARTQALRRNGIGFKR